MTDTIRILLIEDDPSDQQLIRSALQNGLEHVHVEIIDKRPNILATLKSEPVDIVISDYELKGYTAIEVIDDVRSFDRNLPIMILTGEDNEKIAVEILKLGVDEYIVKSLKFIRLMPAKIMHIIDQKQNVSVTNRTGQTDIFDEGENAASVEHNSNRFISAFEKSSLGFAIGDQNGNILAANQAGHDLLGYENQELLGKNFLDVVHPEDREATRADYVRLFSGESHGYNIDRRYIHKDGYTVWCELNVTMIGGSSSGNIPLVMVQAKVINVRKQAEEQSNGLLQSAPDAIVIIKENYEIGLINKQAEILFGYTQAELTGQSIKKLIPAGFQKSPLTHGPLIETNESNLKMEIFELYALNKQGQEFPVDITRSNFETAEGRFESIGIRDITEQKLAIEQLRESNERFQNSFDYAAIGMWLGDRDGKIREVNSATCNMLGYSEEELIGKNYRDLTPEDDLATSIEYHDKLYAGDLDNYRIIKHYLHKEGNYIWVDVSVALVRSNDGTPDYDIVHIVDVTKEKEISEELSYHASHDALTDLVNRREFERRTERLLTNIKVDQHEHALCYMDLDQFKVVNDTCGHVAGDELLRQLSALLIRTVRKRDTLARLGGDEFGILMEHCSLDHAHRVAKTIQKAIQEYQFSWEGHQFRVGISMGLIAITPQNDNLTELMKNADSACYMAKDAGRNRIHIYRSEDSLTAKRQGNMQ